VKIIIILYFGMLNSSNYHEFEIKIILLNTYVVFIKPLILF